MIGFSKWLEEKSIPYQVSSGNTDKHAVTMDYIPSGKTSKFRSKDVHNTNFVLNSDPVVNQLLSLVHQKIDVLVWDYGKDAVERAVDSVAQLVPFQKNNCDKLGRFHKEHIRVYGADNDKRLTGKHETCSINQFRYGVSDRGASIRIPMDTANKGRGYLEDRRPAANLDPYQICTALIETTCGEGFNPDKYGWENYAAK